MFFGSRTETSLGLNLATCSARSSRLLPAARATIWKRSGFSSTISRVWVPMEPVDPKRENF